MQGWLPARALEQIRDPQAGEPLIRATNDDAPAVRDAALQALDGLGSVGVMVGVAALVRPLVRRIDELEQRETNDQQRLAPRAQGDQPGGGGLLQRLLGR